MFNNTNELCNLQHNQAVESSSLMLNTAELSEINSNIQDESKEVQEAELTSTSVENESCSDKDSDDGVSDANIFIGDLDRECTEDDLVKLFSTFGDISQALIKRSKITNHALG